MDLFNNAGLLIYSFVGMIISLSDLVSICKIQKTSYVQTRSERLTIIRIKVYIGIYLYRFGEESLADTNTPLEHHVRRGVF